MSWVDGSWQIHVNLERVLTHAGASFADVLKVTVFLVSIGDRAKINDVRRDYFGSAFPASTLMEVSALAVPGMLVEIEAIVGMPARYTGWEPAPPQLLGG